MVRYCHFGVSPVNYSDSDKNKKGHLALFAEVARTQGFLKFGISPKKKNHIKVQFMTKINKNYGG